VSEERERGRGRKSIYICDEDASSYSLICYMQTASSKSLDLFETTREAALIWETPFIPELQHAVDDNVILQETGPSEIFRNVDAFRAGFFPI
jgi:hypothetical protein